MKTRRRKRHAAVGMEEVEGGGNREDGGKEGG